MSKEVVVLALAVSVVSIGGCSLVDSSGSERVSIENETSVLIFYQVHPPGYNGGPIANRREVMALDRLVHPGELPTDLAAMGFTLLPGSEGPLWPHSADDQLVKSTSVDIWCSNEPVTSGESVEVFYSHALSGREVEDKLSRGVFPLRECEL